MGKFLTYEEFLHEGENPWIQGTPSESDSEKVEEIIKFLDKEIIPEIERLEDRPREGSWKDGVWVGINDPLPKGWQSIDRMSVGGDWQEWRAVATLQILGTPWSNNIYLMYDVRDMKSFIISVDDDLLTKKVPFTMNNFREVGIKLLIEFGFKLDATAFTGIKLGIL